MNKPVIGAIVLAAGASTRMGTAKQLLRFENETLVRRATRAAVDSVCHPVIVVIGSHSDGSVIEREIADTNARIVVNHQWSEGMGSSIRCGIAELVALTDDRATAAVITLCDQPYIGSPLINRLVAAFDAEKSIVAAAYTDDAGKITYGVPALFARTRFAELKSSHGSEGAKRIIASHLTDAVLIDLPEAGFDVDTPDDYRLLQSII